MREKPIITEVRDARHRISARYGHDLRRLVEHYKELQEERRASGKYRYEGDESRRTAIPLTEAEMLALNDKADKQE